MVEEPTLCRICAKPISKGAKKCTECGEYQNLAWRIASGLNLQGLIALVPIVTLAFAFIHDRVETKASNLRIAVVSCSQQSVSIFASNVGNRGAIIGRAAFETSGLPSQPLQIALPPDAKLINGGETRAIELRIDPQVSPGGLVPFEKRGQPACKVRITIETIAFDHALKPQVTECDCPT